jgi:thioredoxin-related protein
MKMIKNTLFSALLLGMTATAFAAGDAWITDFEAAKKKAAAENKDLLVDFTGSDWCSWCIKLNKEVFAHAPFNAGVADTFVLVELDYPRDKSGLSEELQKQNAELKDTYHISGFPTILLLDAKGRPYARTGYQKGGPESYVTHLNELRSKRVKRDESFAAADKLKGVAKATALVAALSDLPESQMSHYENVTEEIATLDPKDETGFTAKKELKVAIKGLEKEVTTLGRADDMKGAAAKVDAFLAAHKLDTEQQQNLLGMKVSLGLQSKDFDLAMAAIDAIIAADPESANGKRAAGFKPNLLKMKEEAAAKSE